MTRGDPQELRARARWLRKRAASSEDFVLDEQISDAVLDQAAALDDGDLDAWTSAVAREGDLVCIAHQRERLARFARSDVP